MKSNYADPPDAEYKELTNQSMSLSSRDSKWIGKLSSAEKLPARKKAG